MEELPIVTIQIPVYKEVADLPVTAIHLLDWPKDKLQIQILFDHDGIDQYIFLKSNMQLIDWLRHKGFDAELLVRTDRRGFKAGALNVGLALAKGEYIAVFDSDFYFPSDWLILAYENLKAWNKRCSLQTRWTFRNRNTSVFTKAIAVLLEAHFLDEKITSYENGLFTSFNGSGGLLRKESILVSGGWSTDTIVEDADLSNALYYNNCRVVYSHTITCNSELPERFNDWVTQQCRWAQGQIQVDKKYGLCGIGWPGAYCYFGLFHLFKLPYFCKIAAKEGKWTDALLIPLIAFAAAPRIVKAIIKGYLGKQAEFILTPKRSSYEQA